MNKLYCSDPQLLKFAEELVRFNKELKLVSDSTLPQDIASNEVSFYLDKRGLHVITKDLGIMCIDEIYNNIIRRGNLTNELLVQAIKLPKTITILDLTAGLGCDSLILARFGYNVIMVERNPLLATIIHYAIRSGIFPKGKAELHHANSLDYIECASLCKYKADVVYLDPMFNDKKSALSKKNMQLIKFIINSEHQDWRDYTGDDTGARHLLLQSMGIANIKVIVKRDNKQAFLGEVQPTHSKAGTTVRYDVYSVLT